MTDLVANLLAERDLLDLLARFDDAAIRNDVVAFRELWTEDAVWQIGDPIPMRAQGPEAIVAALGGFHAQNLFFFRMTARPVIEIEGDHAWLRSSTVELAERGEHRVYANVALYRDEAVRANGTWRFRQRSYDYLWVDTQSELGGQAVPLNQAELERSLP